MNDEVAPVNEGPVTKPPRAARHGSYCIVHHKMTCGSCWVPLRRPDGIRV